ncbi:hypothetical protein [Cellulomonas dongxiuzhuiae]|uniref:DUF4352 domain-containing protein n=1 Tax=Cellulomonas dongxiuzhuiae TaxID=2819979 RepID=A0ABX8GLW8_9CELL|nr:hypothetical protein [Cellulomonas dongxiuzhuiae]MBO3095252.1 hypothetical protein [Cellulomonas dongxiuzhuiae]QWC16249.1 hypothetical protein KKR89_00765 [Cellulomonas dongxiuzhuiae]
MTRSTATRRRTIVVSAAAAALLVAAGCTSTASAGGSATPAEIATYAGTQTAFGQSFTYANGLVVEVKKPAAFAPSAYADGVEGSEGEPVRVRVNIINGTSGEFVPDTVGVVVVSGGEEAVQILDPGTGVDLTGPAQPLDRSGVVAFDLAFVVLDPQDVTLTLTPSLIGYDPLVFTTA